MRLNIYKNYLLKIINFRCSDKIIISFEFLIKIPVRNFKSILSFFSKAFNSNFQRPLQLKIIIYYPSENQKNSKFYFYGFEIFFILYLLHFFWYLIFFTKKYRIVIINTLELVRYDANLINLTGTDFYNKNILKKFKITIIVQLKYRVSYYLLFMCNINYFSSL